MNQTRRGGHVIAQPILWALCSLVLSGVVTESRPALAQFPVSVQPAPGRVLTAEQRTHVWRLQAEAVALGLKLNQDQGDRSVAVYREMRRGRPEAMREANQRQAARFRGRMPKDLSVASTWLKKFNDSQRLKFKEQLERVSFRWASGTGRATSRIAGKSLGPFRPHAGRTGTHR